MQDWQYAFVGVIAKAAKLPEQTIGNDLNAADGLYVNTKLCDKITAALLEQHFVERSDGSTTSYVDPAAPDRGVMMTDDPDDQTTFVWVFFNHEVQ